MKFSAFLPGKIEQIDSALIWLSGLTCNEENFITKSGVQSYLNGTKTMIICPDTSPRGLEIEGENESYDFGTGAGFYVNATTEKFQENYNMYDYVVKDIVTLLKEDFGVNKLSIFGHSMGGHGALTIGLKEKDLFESISAFSPIVNPMECAWGQKAFNGYLGDDRNSWAEYDTCELIKNGARHKNIILVEQGLADEFYPVQLLTTNLESVCTKNNRPLNINYRQGYDHSYYFISSFLESHIKFHLKFLM
jgi:S-formylglutathione hydrolase